jgi:hypothetical protein
VKIPQGLPRNEWVTVAMSGDPLVGTVL